MTGLPPSHGVSARLQRIRRVSVQARPLRTLGVLAIAGVLALPLAASAEPGDGGGHQAPHADDGYDAPLPSRRGDALPDRRWLHSSDGERGELAPDVPAERRIPITTRTRDSFQAAPGVGVKIWDQTDSRGKIRAYLTTVRLNKPGVRVGYLGGRHIPDRQTVDSMVTKAKAVAGVNGDFFDISDTGAALGYAASIPRPMLQAPRYGWPRTFQLRPNGKPFIGDGQTVARLTGRKIGLSNVNPPNVPQGGIALYTQQWGETMGARVTGGQRKNVREVLIRNGKVKYNRSTLSKGDPIRGRMLIARGKGPSRVLARELPAGEKVDITRYIKGRPKLAIGGSTYLMLDGKIVTGDDGEMHPRTAVGIDRDHNRVLLLVVDGRQKFSRGYTLLEMARLLKRLGAEDALNLDGGGSTTLVAKKGRSPKVINSPSDGQQRLVPNGIGVFYEPPARGKNGKNGGKADAKNDAQGPGKGSGKGKRG